MDQLEHILSATATGFRASLYQHMPLSAYRNFNSWALSPQNPFADTWLEMMGIPQFAKLTLSLLGRSVAPSQWDALVEHTTYMNAYLIYETISDNLAFGLAIQRDEDATFDARHEILYQFNNAMIARLKGDRAQSDRLLVDIQRQCENVSGFEQSLTHHEQAQIVAAFIEQFPEYRTSDIEYGTWNALVANVQSCAALVEHMRGYRLESLVRQGLIRRYEAVNALLSKSVADRQTLLDVSIYSILVIPVLAYYIAVLTEMLGATPRLNELLDNGVLVQALEDAALMVRLLNDLGTNLVATDQFHRKLLDDLYAHLKSMHTPTAGFTDLLMLYSQDSTVMTRIRKDVSFGEFNVSLHNLTTSPATPVTLLLFGSNLVYFQKQYRECRQRLDANLAIIEHTLNSDTVSRLIHQFVGFHEHIYRNQFDDQAGDYATKPSLNLMTD